VTPSSLYATLLLISRLGQNILLGPGIGLEYLEGGTGAQVPRSHCGPHPGGTLRDSLPLHAAPPLRVIMTRAANSIAQSKNQV
jgi:hypothetical protein